MSTITVSLYLVNNVLEESSSNNQNPAPQPDATTDIQENDTLQWVLGTNSRISSIDSIAPGKGLTFDPLPTAANSWTCEVKGKISTADPYNYTVYVTASAGGDSKPYDPKIRINPGHI